MSTTLTDAGPRWRNLVREMVRTDGSRDVEEFSIGRFPPISSTGELDGFDPLADLRASPA